MQFFYDDFPVCLGSSKQVLFMGFMLVGFEWLQKEGYFFVFMEINEEKIGKKANKPGIQKEN